MSDPYIEEMTLKDLTDTTHKKLQSIHDVLLEIAEDIHKLTISKEASSVFRIVTLYKAGLGPNWVPRLGERDYIQVYALQATAVLVTSPLAPPTVVTIPATTLNDLWLDFDFPDGSSFILDVSASANSLNIYTKITQVHE